MDERERVLLTLAGVRVFMGVFWLVNLLWRLPTDFGEGNYWGLPRTFEVARTHGVDAARAEPRRRRARAAHDGRRLAAVHRRAAHRPLARARAIVTRLGAALGLLQAIVMTLFLANAPGEWLYGYLMLILLSALLLLLPVSRRLSLDDALGRDP